MADNDPVAIAKSLRAQRRVAVRILLVTLPIAVPGIVLLIFADGLFPPKVEEVIVSIVGIVFLVAWCAMIAFLFIHARDLRNRFRAGSAAAYDDK